MTFGWNEFIQQEQEIIGDLQVRLRRTWNGTMPFLSEVRVRRDKDIRDTAGQRLAYFHDSDNLDNIKGAFNALAKDVIERTARHESP